MPSDVVLLTLADSPLGSRLAPRIERRDAPCRILDLDAAHSRLGVTVSPGNVEWNGVDLLSAGVILLEKPLFPWPQPVRLNGLPRNADERLGAIAEEREVRSLLVSAVRAAAGKVPVVNPPGAALLTVSPASLMALFEGAGVPAGEWRLAPASSARKDEIALDSVGGDRWHSPTTPAGNDPALLLRAVPGPITTLLTVSGEAAGALRFESARAWAGGEGGNPVPALDPGSIEIARRVTEACALPLAEVVMGGPDSTRALYLNPGPDLNAWDSRTEGAALDLLADYLARLALHRTGGGR